MAPPPSPPGAALVDDNVEDVLLRIPPDEPAHLARAALVCRTWYRVASGPDFRRRFRELHRAAAPPMLGFLCNLSGADADASGTAVRFVPTSSFRPPLAGCGRGWRALDSRHGRVLLGKDGNSLVVWDPATGERLVLPEVPRHWETLPSVTSWNAAVLCAGAAGGTVACDHLDCSRRPFLVALVGANLDSEFAHLYSSETGEWSEPTYLFQGADLEYLVRSALVGNAVYFKCEMTTGILKYDLSTREMAVIRLPLWGDYGRHTVLMTTEDGGGLGFAVVYGSRLHLWSRAAGSVGDAGWAQSRVIELKTLLPPILSISPYLVGFADGVGVFFVQTVNGLFSIDLKSRRVRNVHEGSRICSVVPYVSFCTPALGAVSTIEEPEPGAGASSA